MTSKALIESITDYEKITGEIFLQSPDLALKVLGDSFMLWKLAVRDEVPYFWIDQVYARSFSVFVPFIKEVCKVADVEWIVTATTRKPTAHIKKWKMEPLVDLDYEYEGRQYHVLRGHILNLR